MGMFSWNTSNTQESIANVYSARPTFTVTMIDNKGNSWVEPAYKGYGIFGGKDYYQLLAEMNDLPVIGDIDEDRMLGIDLFFKDNSFGCVYKAKEKGVLMPMLLKGDFSTTDKDELINIFNRLSPSEQCEYQGFFYENNKDEEDYDYEDEYYYEEC